MLTEAILDTFVNRHDVATNLFQIFVPILDGIREPFLQKRTDLLSP